MWLAGYGSGGSLAVVEGARNPEVRGVAAMATPADFDDWAKHPRRLLLHARQVQVIKDPDFPPTSTAGRPSSRAVRPLEAAAALAPRPLLVLHGDSDDLTPLEDGQAIAEAHGSAELRVLSGAGHELRHDPRAVAMLLGWLRRQRIAAETDRSRCPKQSPPSPSCPGVSQVASSRSRATCRYCLCMSKQPGVVLPIRGLLHRVPAVPVRVTAAYVAIAVALGSVACGGSDPTSTSTTGDQGTTTEGTSTQLDRSTAPNREEPAADRTLYGVDLSGLDLPAGEPYVDYETVEDDTAQLEIVVPADWDEIDTSQTIRGTNRDARDMGIHGPRRP